MEIEEWLKNPNYATGVEIYKKTKGHNKLLLRQFTMRENAQRKEKLIYELKKFLPIQDNVIENLPPEEVITEDPISKSVETESKRIAPLFHELPIELRPVLLEANNLFKENCMLKVELNELKQNQESEALYIQSRIDANFRANAMCWDKIEYWREHKILPKNTNVQAISEYSMDKLIKQQHLLGSSLSKMLKRLNDNKLRFSTEENAVELRKIQRKISKQESDVIKKREQLLIIKATIDDKTCSI